MMSHICGKYHQISPYQTLRELCFCQSLWTGCSSHGYNCNMYHITWRLILLEYHIRPSGNNIANGKVQISHGITLWWQPTVIPMVICDYDIMDILFGISDSDPVVIQLGNWTIPNAIQKTWDGRCCIGEMIGGKSSWRMQTLATQPKQNK